MKILIVEDDPEQGLSLEHFVRNQGHEPERCANGQEAFARIQHGEYPLVITDWMMPVISGPELCGMIRALSRTRYVYIILMTAMQERARHVEGLNAGADDFIRKPVEFDELAARLAVADRIQRLHDHVTSLEGLLCICAECKKIRDDAGQWVGVEMYIAGRTDVQFSHGLCPVCVAKTRKAWGLAPAPEPRS